MDVDKVDYGTEEFAEDVLDLIREYGEELKQLTEHEKELYGRITESLGPEQAELIKKYVSVRIDKSLRLFELDLRTRDVEEDSESAKVVDSLFKEHYDV